MIDVSQAVEARIGNGDNSNVGIDGAKRIVGRSGTCVGQCVKEGTFADVRQSDDTKFHGC